MAGPLIPSHSPLRKLAAVLLLILVLVALTQWLVRPLAGAFQARHAAIATLEHQLHSLRRIAASRTQAEQRLQQLRQRRGIEGLTFEAANASRAAGLLQQLVTQQITAAGGRVSSIQVLPGDERGGIVRMTARVTASTSPQTLGPVLYALESSVPYLVVQKFTISSRGQGYGRKGPVRAPLLTVSMDVSGFLTVDGAGES